ncbi:MAG TPA: FliM/FliN family flagellar motor switch protein [Terriglobales bacterium]|nr:FliM/FliN family flagellar motor switch protein [Terriglobales bacterium]
MAQAESVRRFVQLWCDSLAQVLGQIAGAPFPIECVDGSAVENRPAENDLYMTVNVGGAVRGEMSLRVPQAGALALAEIFLGEADATGGLTADHRQAVEELQRQVAGHVSTAAKPIWQEISLTVALGEAPTWSPAAAGWIRSGPAALRQLEIEWQASAALSASLASASPPAAATPEEAEGASRASEPAGLGFFMDMELGVTLRFGGCNVLLKEVLELGPGSVLELDREIQDPADLLLDGKLIARGEVVVVNGNYGLRVTEVLTGTQG